MPSKINSKPSTEPVRLFIGSGEASLVERKTLIYSIQKNTRRPLDITVFNGTHNAIEKNGAKPYLAPMSLKTKYLNITEFSLYKFLIPKICGYKGKAIWLDSDMICLSDIGELFDAPMRGHDFLAKRNGASKNRPWELSALLIDCSRCRFGLETFVKEIHQGLYQYQDLMHMSPRFLTRHPYRIGRIEDNWNALDERKSRTKLVHYTNLYTQPWKYARHPLERLWLRYFKEAVRSQFLTLSDVQKTVLRSYVQPKLLDIAAWTQIPPRA